MHEQTLAVIGAGNIGRILIKRLLASGASSQRMLIVDADEARAQSAALEFGIKPAALSEAEVSNADVILICVTPKAVLETLQHLAPHLHPRFARWRHTDSMASKFRGTASIKAF